MIKKYSCLKREENLEKLKAKKRYREEARAKIDVDQQPIERIERVVRRVPLRCNGNITGMFTELPDSNKTKYMETYRGLQISQNRKLFVIKDPTSIAFNIIPDPLLLSILFLNIIAESTRNKEASFLSELKAMSKSLLSNQKL